MYSWPCCTRERMCRNVIYTLMSNMGAYSVTSPNHDTRDCLLHYGNVQSNSILLEAPSPRWLWSSHRSLAMYAVPIPIPILHVYYSMQYWDEQVPRYMEA